MRCAVRHNRRMDAPAELAAWVGRQLGTRRLALRALAAEASTRSFFRVELRTGGVAGASVAGVAGGESAPKFIAMFSPPETEDNPRYVRLAALFRQHGLATPRIHVADLEQGFLLIEDLGDCDFKAAYAQGEVDAPLEAAVQALVRLQRIRSEEIPPYARERFADELAIFTEWLIERFLGIDVADCFGALQGALIEATQSVPQRVIHRDFHCRNLIWRRGDRVGIVDFQDALVGPSCYDIASLLRDCYHEFDEPSVARWRQRFFDLAALDCDAATFARAFDLTAMQRQLKAVGIFARLYLQRDKRSHLHDIVPVLGRLARLAADHPETVALADWIAADVLPRSAARLAALQ